MRFKEALKRIFPMPASSLKYELTQLAEISQSTQERLQQLLEFQAEFQDTIQQQIHGLMQAISTCDEDVLRQEQLLKEFLNCHQAALARFEEEKIKQRDSLEMQNKLLEALVQKIDVLPKDLEELSRKSEALSKMQDSICKTVQRTERTALEEVWAHIFNNTISDSKWLVNKKFSPGRWAVGYPYLYAMYRVLNEIHPKHILELGLGQSTRMIAQYAAADHDVSHTIVEHDPEWINFFNRDFELPPNSKIVRLEREFVPYNEAESVRVFHGFKEAVGNQIYDFISVDAPLGGDMKQYARIDVLELIPQCLADEFVIMIDDTERSGERNMIRELQQSLKNAGFEFQIGKYSGQKECTLLCSRQLSFLKSM